MIIRYRDFHLDMTKVSVTTVLLLFITNNPQLQGLTEALAQFLSR